LSIKPLYRVLQDPRGHPEKKAPRETRESKGKKDPKDHQAQKE